MNDSGLLTVKAGSSLPAGSHQITVTATSSTNNSVKATADTSVTVNALKTVTGQLYDQVAYRAYGVGCYDHYLWIDPSCENMTIDTSSSYPCIDLKKGDRLTVTFTPSFSFTAAYGVKALVGHAHGAVGITGVLSCTAGVPCTFTYTVSSNDVSPLFDMVILTTAGSSADQDYSIQTALSQMTVSNASFTLQTSGTGRKHNG